MNLTTRRLTSLLVALLVASTGVFAVGVGIERGSGHDEASEGSHSQTATEAEGEAGHDESAEARERGEATSESTVLGVDPESTAAVLVVVALSLLAAAAVATTRPPSTGLLVGVTVAGAAAVVLDVAEITHQADEGGSSTVAVLATVVTVLHAGVALTGLRLLAAERWAPVA